MTPFCQQIAKQMITIPDKLCLVDQLGNRLTYADVDRLTGQVVTYLRCVHKPASRCHGICGSFGNYQGWSCIRGS